MNEKEKKIITSRLLPSGPDKSDSVSKLQELLIKEEGAEKEGVEKEDVEKEGVDWVAGVWKRGC